MTDVLAGEYKLWDSFMCIDCCKELRENIISDPDDLVAATNLAIVFREQGRYDEAAQILTRIRNDHPGSTLAVRAEILLGTFPHR